MLHGPKRVSKAEVGNRFILADKILYFKLTGSTYFPDNRLLKMSNIFRLTCLKAIVLIIQFSLIFSFQIFLNRNNFRLLHNINKARQ